MKWLIVSAFVAVSLFAVVVATVNYSNVRLGSQNTETLLTPTSVQTASFGKRGSYALDGAVYAQPLYVPGVTVSGATYNGLFTVTMNCSAYLLNADIPGAVIWGPLSLCAPRITAFPQNYQPQNSNLTYPGYAYGCLSTPAVDGAGVFAYALCLSNTPTAVLSKINLSTQALTQATATATFPGTGDARTSAEGDHDTCMAGTCTFYPLFESSRAGLLLLGSHIYSWYGSFADSPPYHGWIMSHNTSDLSLANALMTTPTTGGGGIWTPGGGPSSDGTYIYVTTGNGTNSPNSCDGTTNYAQAVLKLTQSLAIQDFYIPSNCSTLNTNDSDLSSGTPMLIPGTAQLVFGAKDFNLYNVNTACMGGIGGTNNGCTAPQVFGTGTPTITDHSGIYGQMYLGAGSTLYAPNTGANLYSFSLSGPSFNTSPVANVGPFAFPGAQMSGSSNGASTGLVWSVVTTGSTSALYSPQAGKLQALNPATLATLYDSSTLPQDYLGTMAKFSKPTVANGRVYVGTLDGTVVAYGVSQPGTYLMLGRLH